MRKYFYVRLVLVCLGVLFIIKWWFELDLDYELMLFGLFWYISLWFCLGLNVSFNILVKKKSGVRRVFFGNNLGIFFFNIGVCVGL